MAHSKANVLLALLLFSAAGPVAGASVMRVHSGGDLEMLQTESVSGLANMFSDDPEAQAVTAKLLAEGKPSDDLLPFVQKLKQQILPWHDNSEATLKAAIADIEACQGSMDNGLLGTKGKQDLCSGKSSEHKASRKEESTKFETKEQWKAQEAEKKEIMTTECNIFDKVEDEARKASASYSGGDEEAYLESTTATFCDDLLPRYRDAKQKCTSATAEHVQVSQTYEAKKTAWTVQKTASDGVQTEMDETCCEYAMATKDVCTAHDTCYEDKVEAYNAVEAIIKGEEKVKKTEWRVYSRIECLLPVLGTDKAGEIEECRKKTHDTSRLDIDYPSIPEKSECHAEDAFPGTDAYYKTEFGDLPADAKGKAVAKCTGMMGSSSKATVATVASAQSAEDYCAAQCQAAGFCCNDWRKGSNQMISCAQACMMRSEGSKASELTAASGGMCKRHGQSGCSLTVSSVTYGFCSSCSDLQANNPKCSFGVASPEACDFGATLSPPGAEEEASLPSGSNQAAPASYKAKAGSAACRCRGSGWGLDSCGSLCCKASPYTDPDSSGKYYFKKNNANAVLEDSLCYEKM